MCTQDYQYTSKCCSNNSGIVETLAPSILAAGHTVFYIRGSQTHSCLPSLKLTDMEPSKGGPAKTSVNPKFDPRSDRF